MSGIGSVTYDRGKPAFEALPLTIAIPTYRREQVLIETIESLLALDPRAAEILVLDQTADHEPQTEVMLRKWNEEGQVRWIRLAEPSIPGAMNKGLLEARQDTVLFLDDDIVPFDRLLTVHVNAHQGEHRLVAGFETRCWQQSRY